MWINFENNSLCSVTSIFAYAREIQNSERQVRRQIIPRAEYVGTIRLNAKADLPGDREESWLLVSKSGEMSERKRTVQETRKLKQSCILSESIKRLNKSQIQATKKRFNETSK